MVEDEVRRAATSTVSQTIRGLEQVGGFDEDLTVFEDYEIEQRIQGAGFRLGFIQSAPIHHVARGRILESLRHSWACLLQRTMARRVRHRRATL